MHKLEGDINNVLNKWFPLLIISLDNDNMKPLNCDEKDYYLFKLPNQLQYTEQHSYTQGQGAVKSQERTKLQLQTISFKRERSYNFKLFPLYVSPSINKISELWRWLRTIRIVISHANITGSSSLYKWTPVNCVGDQRRLLLQYYCHFMLNYCVSLNRSPPAFYYPFTSWNL